MPGRGRPFEKGHKFAKGGARPNSGPITKAKLAERESLRQMLERMLEERAEELATAYHAMALGKKEETATMRHLVDKVLPAAKTTVVIEAGGELEQAVRRIEEKKSGRNG